MECLKDDAGPPKVAKNIGTPACPALIALAGCPPTARQIGNEPSCGRGMTLASFNGARNCPLQLTTFFLIDLQ